MYRLTLLGGVSLEGTDGPLSGRVVQRRQLALLAILACTPGRSLAREKAVGLLWPERPEEKARGLLADTAYVIRQTLGEEAVVSESVGLRLNAGVLWSDVAAFEEACEEDHWEEAANLYAGPFLEGAYLSPSGAFERWVEEERRRLADRHGEALERLAQAAEAEGDWTGAAGWWKRRAAEEPTNSRVAVRLMKALAAAGNVPGALEHARVHEVLLREELDIPVSQEVRALAEELHQRPRSQPSPTAGDPIGGPRPVADRDAPAGSGLGEGTQPPGAFPEGEPAGGGGHGGRSGSGGGRPAEESSGNLARSRHAPPYHASRVGRRLLGGIAALALAGGVAAGWLFLGSPGDPGPLGASPDGIPDRVVAVLPFDNLGPEADEYFADGISEELTARLSAVSGLGVVGTASTRRYRDSDRGPREFGEDVGADYVLRGSVRWDHEVEGTRRVRVTPQLVRVADGTNLWAEVYDRELTELFAIQTEIAERVAVDGLDIALAEPEREDLGREPTEDLEAYALYLQGNQYGTPPTDRRAIALYERAVELDPGFVDAWQRLVLARIFQTWAYGEVEQGIQAREDLERLLALVDEDHPQARLARAWFLYMGERRYEGALREFEAVRRTQPRNADVLTALGAVERRLGRWEDAVSRWERVLELDPLNEAVTINLGFSLQRMGRHDDAERYYAHFRVLQSPADPEAERQQPESGELFARLHLVRGDTARAWEIVDRGPPEFRADPFFGHRIYLYRHRDDLAAVIEPMREAPAPAFRHRLHRYDALADALAGIGNEEARAVYADSLLELATETAQEDWEGPRSQHATLGWVFSGLALIHRGGTEAALRHVRRALELEASFRDAATGPTIETWAARAFTRLGRHEEALDLLEGVLSVPSWLTTHDLRLDPEWDPLRDHPRFRALVDSGD